MKPIMYLFEELVKDIGGSACIKILKLLEGKENVSEFVLAENMDMNINELRTYLYKLSEKNLIYSTRRKDKQKGWYVYYWTFNFRHGRDLIIKNKEKQLEDLKNKINNKEIPKYICPNRCMSAYLEDAMEIQFKCPECNSLLKLKEIKYDEEVLKNKINEIEKQMDELRQSIIVEIVPKEKKELAKKPKAKITKKKPAKKKNKKITKKKEAKKSNKPKKETVNKKAKKSGNKKNKIVKKAKKSIIKRLKKNFSR